MEIEIFSNDWEQIGFDINDYLGCMDTGEYIEPPISQKELINLYGVGAYHPSALQAKVNILSGTFIPNKYLSLVEFRKFAFSYFITGNGYLEQRKSVFGNTVKLENLPAKFMRVASNKKDFVLLQPFMQDNIKYKQAQILHIKEYDLNQEIYGRPYYIGALQGIHLNNNATVFRNRYYINGSHAGFILYLSDNALNKDDYDALKMQLRNSKGAGNFKNIVLRSPNASKDGVQLIPISEVAAKDEFLNIKNATREDILAAHRVSPQLMSILPNNTGGFGDVIKAANVFSVNEIEPIQLLMIELNNQLNIKAFDFKEYLIKENDN